MSAHPGTLHKPLPHPHVSPKPVLAPAAPIICGGQWDFGVFWKTTGTVVAEWVWTWGWREGGVRDSQCRFWRTEWQSQRSPGCPSAPSFPQQRCPLSCPTATPAACLRGQEADVRRGGGRLFPVSPGKGKASGSGASRLLLALCHGGREATLKTSSAFLGSSTTLEGLSNSLERTRYLP